MNPLFALISLQYRASCLHQVKKVFTAKPTMHPIAVELFAWFRERFKIEKRNYYELCDWAICILSALAYVRNGTVQYCTVPFLVVFYCFAFFVSMKSMAVIFLQNIW